MIDLKEIEEIMDQTNTDYGSKEKYCIYCEADTYNSVVGILHYSNCIITTLRKEIKDLEK